MKKLLIALISTGLLIGIITSPPPSDQALASANTGAASSTNTAVGNNSSTTVRTTNSTTTSTQSSNRSTRTPVRSSTSPQTPAAQSGPLLYVALGDSVASGAGLAESANATANDQTCDRSSQAYPYLVAQGLQTTVNHLACSGAKVDEGIYGEQSRSGTDIPSQLDGAFASGVPDVMTMTVGANDVRWTSFIRQCYAVTCGTRFDEARAKVYRADLRLELYRALNQIESRSQGTPPQVLISGYYTPIADASCVTTERITSSELTWLKAQTADLNQAIRSVVPYFDFVEFVPISFAGHELCSSEPWIQGADAEAPFHPTAEGQAAISEAFLTRLQ